MDSFSASLFPVKNITAFLGFKISIRLLLKRFQKDNLSIANNYSELFVTQTRFILKC